MKELSIEVKAKRYDEAIERAKSLIDFCSDSELKTLEYVFHELKESDGERIRKALKQYFVNSFQNNDVAAICGVHIKDAIAWLEKQSNNMGISKATKQKLEDSLNEALEKETPESFNAFLDEQKPADKVEPKFREGEWIIHQGTENIYQVVAIIDNQYQLKYGDNYTTQYCEDVDRCTRLWDVAKDAKDGDLIYVSTEEKGIQAIFHEYKNRTIFFHCYLCSDFVQDCYMPIGSVELACPLQKVHYKRFFEKMHEAGYEWDAEKKELKKIGQKPADTEKGAKGNEREIPISEPPLTLKHAKEVMGIKQNHAWSEEDEMFVHGLIRGLAAKKNIHGHTTFSSDNIDITKTIDWLKFLKDRYTWKPSDEQIEALADALSLAKNCGEESAFDLRTLYEQIKRLREE